MSIERLTPPELLSKNKFNVDEERASYHNRQSHLCQVRGKTLPLCMPAVLYKLDKNGR